MPSIATGRGRRQPSAPGRRAARLPPVPRLVAGSVPGREARPARAHAAAVGRPRVAVPGRPAGAAPAYRAVLVAHEAAVRVDVELDVVAAADAVIAQVVAGLVDLQPVAILPHVDLCLVVEAVGVRLAPDDLPGAAQVVVAAPPTVGRGRQAGRVVRGNVAARRPLGRGCGLSRPPLAEAGAGIRRGRRLREGGAAGCQHDRRGDGANDQRVLDQAARERAMREHLVLSGAGPPVWRPCRPCARPYCRAGPALPIRGCAPNLRAPRPRVQWGLPPGGPARQRMRSSTGPSGGWGLTVVGRDWCTLDAGRG